MELLEKLVVKSVEGFGGREDGMFNTAHFSGAIKEKFRLAECPDGSWCSRVLSRLPYVVPMPHGCHWLYRPVRATPFVYREKVARSMITGGD